MSPVTLKNLREAREFVNRELNKRTSDDVVIQGLVRHFGAKMWDAGYAGHKLRCLGVIGSCTTTRHGLLMSWSRCAERRLQREAMQ